MLYVVEIPGEHAEMATLMSGIREWLDAQRSEPDAFRYTKTESGVTFRIEFKAVSEAIACADAFQGRLVSGSGK